MKPIIEPLIKAYRAFVCCASCLQSPFLLAVRLYWGWQFIMAGFPKLTNLDRTAGFFANMHIPMPKLSALLAGSTECFGGCLLVIGLASRLASIPLIITMMVAYATAESEALGQIFSNPGKFYGATPFTFLLASLIVLVFGPGKFSLDYWLGLGEPKKCD
jgi:putative oxidoreductase